MFVLVEDHCPEPQRSEWSRSEGPQAAGGLPERPGALAGGGRAGCPLRALHFDKPSLAAGCAGTSDFLIAWAHLSKVKLGIKRFVSLRLVAAVGLARAWGSVLRTSSAHLAQPQRDVAVAAAVARAHAMTPCGGRWSHRPHRRCLARPLARVLAAFEIPL